MSTMTDLSLQITYRHGRQLAAYLHLPRDSAERVDHCEEAVHGIVVDYSADGRPVGIEIVSPGHITIDQIQQVLEDLGIGRVADSELSPLEAA